MAAARSFKDPIEPMDLADMRKNGVRSLDVCYGGAVAEVVINAR
jgi:hypothetical protein